MIVIGVAFLVDWLLMQVFSLNDLKAALVTAIIFIVAGVLLGERPWEKL